MPQEQLDYASYLLRFWKSNERGGAAWRASLECTQTAQRHNFPSLEALVAFLEAQFGQGQGESVVNQKSHKERKIS